MIGTVIVTHCSLGAELIKTAEFILGSVAGMVAVSVDAAESTEQIRQKIEGAINKVDQGDGMIILTDMFGGTPSNLSLSFHDSERLEVVTGVNLSMVIKLAQARENASLDELAESVAQYGRKSIQVAGAMLQPRHNGEGS